MNGVNTANELTFPLPALTVDLVIFTVREEQLQVLLVRRANAPFCDAWALPGGYVDIERDDDLEACARRKLKEKSGVDAPYLEQLKSYGSKGRDPRRWTATVVYFALIASDAIVLGGNQRQVAWHPIVDHGVAQALAFDHAELIADAIARLRAKLEYTHIAVHLLPEVFTLPELQRIYEIVLGAPLEKSSFRRRVSQAEMLEPLPGQRREGDGRPAQLYRFRSYRRQTFFPRSLQRHAR